MELSEIARLIESGLPGAKADVTGGDGKYTAVVVSEAFAGKSMVEEHRMVYATVKPHIESGALHALTIKAFTPEEWAHQSTG